MPILILHSRALSNRTGNPKQQGIHEYLEPETLSTNVAFKEGTSFLGTPKCQHGEAYLDNSQTKSENRRTDYGFSSIIAIH